MNKAVEVNAGREEVTTVNSGEGAASNTPIGGGDDLTEAELQYFRSGGQDVSGLLKDDIYKDNAETLQSSEEHTEAEARPNTQETPPDPAVDKGSKTPDSIKSTEVKDQESTIGEDEDFDFDNLRVGPDGRLRDPNGKFVPLKALQKERERFREQRNSNVTLEEENKKLRDSYTKLESRLDTLQQLWQNPQQQQQEQQTEDKTPKSIVEQIMADAGEAPDHETDVFAHAKWLQGVMAKQSQALAALEERLITQTQEIREKEIEPVRQQLTEQEKINYYRQDASSFARSNPAFGEAYKHLINQRHATLALTGFTDANQRLAQIRNEERELVDMAIQQNQRPAEFIYNYAVAMGFKPTVADPVPAPNPAAGSTSPAPAPAAPPPPASMVPGAPAPNEAAQRLMNAQAAQNAAGTLSGAGGAAAEQVNAEAIANMSDEEFLALHQKLGDKGMRPFLTGRG